MSEGLQLQNSTGSYAAAQKNRRPEGRLRGGELRDDAPMLAGDVGVG